MWAQPCTMAAAPESIPADVVCDMLAAYGVDVNENEFKPKSVAIESRWTLLHKAAKDGDVAMVEAALAAGCEVDRQDSIGRSALQVASLYGRVDVVRALLAAGAAPDHVSGPASGDAICTALVQAVAGGHVDVINVLLEAGADVMRVSFFPGKTPLHIAAQEGQLAAIHVLLDAGAPVDGVCENASTPLDDALHFGFRNCLWPLLRAGAILDDSSLRWLSPKDKVKSRVERSERNASAWRYIERVEAAGGYYQLVRTYRRVLTAPQSCLSWFLKFHCEIRFGLGAFPHDLVPLVLAFWKPPGGP